MRHFIAMAFFVASSAAIPAQADVQIAMNSGRVSLTAHDATPQQILAEWARVGRTQIVNMDRVPGGPMTLQLTDVPERQALMIVLRAVSGYLAAPRPTYIANASRFDRIIVMATAARPGSIGTSTPSASRSNDDAEQAGPPPSLARPPVFSPFPAPDSVQQQAQPVASPPPAAQAPVQGPTLRPTVPVGTSAPGMILPASVPPQPVANPQPTGQQP